MYMYNCISALTDKKCQRLHYVFPLCCKLMKSLLKELIILEDNFLKRICKIVKERSKRFIWLINR